MPDPTSHEIAVTTYVYGRFGGTGYSTYSWNGGTVYTFGNALSERWFDTDNDGYFDYGRRDEGNGVWSTFHGNGWEDDFTPPPRDPPGEDQGELDPNGFIADLDETFDGAVDFVPPSTFFEVIDTAAYQPTIDLADDGWIL